MKEYKRGAFLQWYEIYALSRSFADKYKFILESCVEREETSMYFLFRFNTNDLEAYESLFEVFDRERNYNPKEEIGDDGWATIPEDSTRRMINSLDVLGFQAGEMLATGDGVYFFKT